MPIQAKPMVGPAGDWYAAAPPFNMYPTPSESVIQAKRWAYDPFWKANAKTYEECKKRGEKLWNWVEESLKSGKPKDEPTTEKELDKEGAMKAIEQAEKAIKTALPDTKTDWSYDDEEDPPTVEITTVGDKKYQNPKTGGKYDENPKFSNILTPEAGEIYAAVNTRCGYPKPNSEVLWLQYKLAKRIVQIHKSYLKKGKPNLKEIEEIERNTISNPETRTVARLCAPTDNLFLKLPYKYDPRYNSDDFKALLGTPNARSAAYILKDHNKHMKDNKTIESITTKAKGEAVPDFTLDLVIKFKNAS
jgi:hypothetical protein